MTELDLDKLDNVTGGKNDGGFDRKPREKSGCVIYKIQPGDTLSKIALHNGTTVNRIMGVNPNLKNPNFIVPGHYIYIPE